jgi:adenylate cyclase
MPNIQIINTDGRISNFPILKDIIVIGRGKENDLVLPDQSVSRNHARINKIDTGFFLTDLGSFNGTKVNEKSIQSIRLKNNDEIKVGKIMLKFSTGEKPAQSPVQTVVLTKENDYKKGHSTIIESSAEDSLGLSSQDLLIFTGIGKSPGESDLSLPSEKVSQPSKIREELLSLERMNKVLFVLYEISKQLHLIHDFNELLKKIMDFIFIVIDADYGFVILTSDEGKDELAPVVVKYKDDKAKGKGEIKASRTIINKVVNDKVALLTADAMADTRLENAQSLFSQKIRSAMCVPLWKKDKVIGVIQLDSVRFNNQFTEDDLELLKAIGHQMAMVIEQASLNEQVREEERMISRLERYHSPQIIEMILKGSQETKENIMESKDLTATIFFTDIIGFTPLSEKMPPREINLLLNQFFSRMTDIIFKYDGTLDKYIGDCIMAVFGAPMEKKDDPERAILAALEMKRELRAIMKKTEPEKNLTYA